jgi:hypothetical protein
LGPLRLILRLAVVVLVALSLPPSVREVGRLVEDLRVQVARIQTLDPRSRTVSTLLKESSAQADAVPGALDAAALLRPVLGRVPPRRLEIAFVSPGDPRRSLRGLRVLIHECAPDVWGIPLPLDELQAGLREYEATGNAPGLSTWMQGIELLLFHDTDERALVALCDHANRLLGKDALVLGRVVPGGGAGRVHGVVLLRGLVTRIRAGDPAAKPFAALLP